MGMIPSNPIHGLDVSRRQVLASTGSLVVGGSALAWLQSKPASAATSIRELDIPQESVSSTDGTAEAVDCQVSSAYQYQVNQADSLEWQLLLAADESSNFQPIDTVTESAAANSGSGQVTLSGSVVDHPAYALEDFSPGPEETVDHAIPVRASFRVLSGGEAVVEALAETVASVSVTNETIEATAAVTGEGEVAVEM